MHIGVIFPLSDIRAPVLGLRSKGQTELKAGLLVVVFLLTAFFAASIPLQPTLAQSPEGSLIVLPLSIDVVYPNSFTVDVQVQDVVNLTWLGFRIAFDHNLMSFEGYEYILGWGNAGCAQESPGVYTCSGSTPGTTVISGTVTFLTVTFSCLAGGSSSISIADGADWQQSGSFDYIPFAQLGAATVNQVIPSTVTTTTTATATSNFTTTSISTTTIVTVPPTVTTTETSTSTTPTTTTAVTTVGSTSTSVTTTLTTTETITSTSTQAKTGIAYSTTTATQTRTGVAYTTTTSTQTRTAIGNAYSTTTVIQTKTGVSYTTTTVVQTNTETGNFYVTVIVGSTQTQTGTAYATVTVGVTQTRTGGFVYVTDTVTLTRTGIGYTTVTSTLTRTEIAYTTTTQIQTRTEQGSGFFMVPPYTSPIYLAGLLGLILSFRGPRMYLKRKTTAH
jgi:hypothetical protein